MRRNEEAFGAEFLDRIQAAEYGCSCGDVTVDPGDISQPGWKFLHPNSDGFSA